MSHIGNATTRLAASLSRLGGQAVTLAHAGTSRAVMARPGQREYRVDQPDGSQVIYQVTTWTILAADIPETPDRTTKIIEPIAGGGSRTWQLAFPGTEHGWHYFDTARSAKVLNTTLVPNA